MGIASFRRRLCWCWKPSLKLTSSTPRLGSDLDACPARSANDIRPHGVKDGIGPSEGPGPGSNPGRDTGKRRPASVPDRTAVFESARRGSTPRRGTEDETSSECAGFARDPAKVEDQVQFLARTLLTLEPDGKATACKAVRSGFDSRRRLLECRDSSRVRRAGQRRLSSETRRLATRVPNMGSDEGACRPPVSSVVEHQTIIWLSRVRLPYQHRRLQTCSRRPE